MTDLTRLDLVVNVRFPGDRAHGIQVAAMAEALADTGLNVDVVVPRRFPYRATDPWEHYGVRRTFGVHRIANIDTIDMVPSHAQRVPFLVQSVTFGLRALARVAVERDAGVLVRDHYTTEILVGGLRGSDRDRLAAEVHNLPQDPGRRKRLMTVLRKLRAVITISDGLKDELVGEGLEPDNVLVARDGVHLHRYAGQPEAAVARQHIGVNVERPTVVYAGQLYEWKGVDTLIAAFEHLPDAQLVVVGGDRENLPRIEAAVQRHAPGRVVLTGQVNPMTVPFYLAAADVIALPNSAKEEISRRFTSPLKMFEAMASERALVASDIPSLREVLVHEQNALLAAPDDPAALADALRRALDDEALRERLATRAREDVEAFDWRERGRNVAHFLRDRLILDAR